eukprot:gene14630-20664_t
MALSMVRSILNTRGLLLWGRHLSRQPRSFITLAQHLATQLPRSLVIQAASKPSFDDKPPARKKQQYVQAPAKSRGISTSSGGKGGQDSAASGSVQRLAKVIDSDRSV